MALVLFDADNGNAIEPERTEITMQPWKPYKMTCPYANVKENNDD